MNEEPEENGRAVVAAPVMEVGRGGAFRRSLRAASAARRAVVRASALAVADWMVVVRAVREGAVVAFRVVSWCVRWDRVVRIGVVVGLVVSCVDCVFGVVLVIEVEVVRESRGRPRADSRLVRRDSSVATRVRARVAAALSGSRSWVRSCEGWGKGGV